MKCLSCRRATFFYIYPTLPSGFPRTLPLFFQSLEHTTIKFGGKFVMKWQNVIKIFLRTNFLSWRGIAFREFVACTKSQGANYSAQSSMKL